LKNKTDMLDLRARRLQFQYDFIHQRGAIFRK